MKIRLRRNSGTSIMVVLAAVIFLAAGILPSAVGATPRSDGPGKKGVKQGKRHHGPVLGIWRNQRVIAQLEITREQVGQLRDAAFASREKSLAMKARLDQMRLQMEKAFYREKIDQASVRQLAQQMADVKGQLFVLQIEDRLVLGTILTPDQIQKLGPDTMHRKRGAPGIGLQRSAGGRSAAGFGGTGDRRSAR